MSVEITSYGNVSDAVEDGNNRALLELVTKVTAQAKVLCSVATGQLRNSIMGRVKGEDIGFNQGGKEPAPRKISEVAKDGEGYVGSAVAHAVYNEFGTFRLAAQPFLRPAVEIAASGSKARATVIKYQEEAVARGMKKGPRRKSVV